ncbi:hypothetical protein KSP40_PGU020076 [Platanthera guangdongensis]|uniref:Uncharacterized protein n=1 Tax=Platanthera guangdongensis TaxID=2320717 RepID=A0ABR2M1B2_9ASPA
MARRRGRPPSPSLCAPSAALLLRRRLHIPLLTLFSFLLLLAFLSSCSAVLRRANDFGRRCFPHRSTFSGLFTPDANRSISIAMVTFSEEGGGDGERRATRRRSFSGLMAAVGGNKRAYAARMGYDFIDARDLVDPSRPPSWSKVLAVRSQLPAHHWVFWNDADTVVTNPDISLEDILGAVIGQEASDICPDLVVTEDVNGINAARIAGGGAVVRCQRVARREGPVVDRQNRAGSRRIKGLGRPGADPGQRVGSTVVAGSGAPESCGLVNGGQLLLGVLADRQLLGLCLAGVLGEWGIVDHLTALPNMFFGRAVGVAAAPKSRKIAILESRKITTTPEIALPPRSFPSLLLRESSALDRGKSPSPSPNPLPSLSGKPPVFLAKSSSTSRTIFHRCPQGFTLRLMRSMSTHLDLQNLDDVEASCTATQPPREAAGLQIVSMEKHKIFL